MLNKGNNGSNNKNGGSNSLTKSNYAASIFEEKMKGSSLDRSYNDSIYQAAQDMNSG